MSLARFHAFPSLKPIFSNVIFWCEVWGSKKGGLMKIQVFCNFLPTCTASYPIIFEFLSYLISYFHVVLLILTGRFSILFSTDVLWAFLFSPIRKKRSDPPSLSLHITWSAIGCVISLFLFSNTQVDLQLAVHSRPHTRQLITMMWFFTVRRIAWLSGISLRTVIPRLTKIISYGVTFVSRNVISRRFLYKIV